MCANVAHIRHPSAKHGTRRLACRCGRLAQSWAARAHERPELPAPPPPSIFSTLFGCQGGTQLCAAAAAAQPRAGRRVAVNALQPPTLHTPPLLYASWQAGRTPHTHTHSPHPTSSSKPRAGRRVAVKAPRRTLSTHTHTTPPPPHTTATHHTTTATHTHTTPPPPSPQHLPAACVGLRCDSHTYLQQGRPPKERLLGSPLVCVLPTPRTVQYVCTQPPADPSQRVYTVCVLQPQPARASVLESAHLLRGALSG